MTPGEHMTYRLSLRGMELASYEISVGDVTDVAGHHAISVQSHARAVGLVKAVSHIDDTFTSWIDEANGRPLVWDVDEFETKGERKEKTEVRMLERAGNDVPVMFHIDDEAPAPEPQRVSLPETWDFNAFLVALRSWDVPEGTSTTLECFRSRYLWNVTVVARGTETITTGLEELGEVKARRFDGHTFKLARDGSRFPDSEARDFSIWISADGDRVPLKTTARTDYGDIEMSLVDYDGRPN